MTISLIVNDNSGTSFWAMWKNMNLDLATFKDTLFDSSYLNFFDNATTIASCITITFCTFCTF